MKFLSVECYVTFMKLLFTVLPSKPPFYKVKNLIRPQNPKMICLDVISQSLGFEIFNGLMNVIIEKKRILPIEETFDFNVRFSKLELAFFKINYYQGEHRLVQNNKLFFLFR